MPTSGDFKSGDFFSDQHSANWIFHYVTPPPPQRISHLIWPPIPLPPPHPNFMEKPGSICQGLQLVEYSSNQTLTYIGVTRKKLSSFCLQWTTCITLENEARNCNTSIRSQMILEFWNIWHKNCIQETPA